MNTQSPRARRRHATARRAGWRTPRVALLIAVLALAPHPSRADTPTVGGTSLSWWACPGNANAAPGVPFDCVAESGTVYTLVGTFATDREVQGAVAVNADVSVAFPGETTVPSFWSIDKAGCNSFGFWPVKGMPVSCDGHLNAFCAGDSNQCDLLLTAEVNPFSGILKLAITLAGPRTTLHAGQKYYAFAINFPMIGAATCTGCAAPSAIGFSRGTIYSTDDQGHDLQPVAVTGGHPGANACATANDGYSECTTVPTKRRSWGQLKSLYR